jgi:hypothetical protein
MPFIFRKTAKGTAEIDTRAHRLPPRIRSTLVLVDGKRDVDDLKVLISQQADESLRFLSEHGFIESVGETLRAAAPVVSAPAMDLATLRRACVRSLNDELGPAAQSLAMRIERAASTAELAPLLDQAVQLVTSARGKPAGEAFAARLPAL